MACVVFGGRVGRGFVPGLGVVVVLGLPVQAARRATTPIPPPSRHGARPAPRRTPQPGRRQREPQNPPPRTPPRTRRSRPARQAQPCDARPAPDRHRQQHSAEQPTFPARVLPGQPGAQQYRHTDGDPPVHGTGRDTKTPCAHARTLAAPRCRRMRPADERPTTAPAVPARRLPCARQSTALPAAARKDCPRRTTSRATDRHAQGTTQNRGKSPHIKEENAMSAAHVLVAAAEGGVVGDGRTGANPALGVGLTGVAIGWLSLARIAGRISTGNAPHRRPVGLGGGRGRRGPGGAAPGYLQRRPRHRQRNGGSRRGHPFGADRHVPRPACSLSLPAHRTRRRPHWTRAQARAHSVSDAAQRSARTYAFGAAPRRCR